MNSVNGSGKIIAVLAVCMLLICFSACGGSNTAPATDTAFQTEVPSQKADEQTASETNPGSYEEAPESTATITATDSQQETISPETSIATTTPPSESKSEETQSETSVGTEEEPTVKMLTLKIGGMTVAVDWEENESVAALAELVKEKPLTIRMSMYGGFEQVGPLGTNIPRSDVQTTMQAGGIVLYSGNQIVVFYGSNSWSYTRLGHITDKTAAQMKDLLGNENVAIEISIE